MSKHIIYYPMDISPDVLDTNSVNIKRILPELSIVKTPGDYFDTLNQLECTTPRIIMFMGSTIGNYESDQAVECLQMAYSNMMTDDLLLVGVDLKKDPQIILNAYNDTKGVTRQFNLNLLTRINRELAADFNLDQFDHYPLYDAETGTTYSYLRSLQKQQVMIGDHAICFDEDELLQTEISQKYSLDDMEQLRQKIGFRTVDHFLDSRSYFSVSVFKK